MFLISVRIAGRFRIDQVVVHMFRILEQIPCTIPPFRDTREIGSNLRANPPGGVGVVQAGADSLSYVR